MLLSHRRESLVRVVVTGKHRARFLHAMTTAEIQKLTPGQATLALVATSNGKHVGQLRIEVDDASLSLVTEAGSLEPILETLKKHKVADDVRFGPIVEGELTLALYGDLPESYPDGLKVTRWDAATSELGLPTAHVRGPIEVVEAYAATLPATALDAEQWHARRIANGWPLDGVDLHDEDLALFSERLLAGVSWNKGCFLGQEVFVMARDRGEVPKRLRGLTGVGPWPAPGAPLVTAEGKSAGVLGSANDGRALAVVKRKLAEPGTVLSLEDGRAVTVVALPFSS